MATEATTIATRETIKAQGKSYSFIKSTTGDVVSYTLEDLKSKLGLTVLGIKKDDKSFAECLAYDGGNKVRFQLMHTKSKQTFPVWASGEDKDDKLKGEINAMESVRTSKNGNPYYHVDVTTIAFYEVVNQETGELGLIVGRKGEGNALEAL